MVTHHALHVKRLNSDDLVFAHQLERLLVKKVHTSVIYLLVNSGYANTLLRSVGRTFLLPREPALLATKLTFMLAKRFGIIDSIAVAIGVELRKTDVDANHATCVRFRNNFLLNAKRYKVFTGRSFRHGGVKDAPIEGTRKFSLYLAELR